MSTTNYISSIYIYNNKLFIGHISGLIKVYDYPEKRIPFRQTIQHYLEEVKANETIIDMQALDNVLFASTSNSIFAFDFKKSEILEDKSFFTTIIPNCSNIKIDYERNILFAFSSSRGIVALDIRNVRKPKYITSIEPQILKDTGNLDLTELDVRGNILFLAIRKSKIIRLDLIIGQIDGKLTFDIKRELNKINLIDPQDVKYLEHKNLLFIADAELGILIYNLVTTELVYNHIFVTASEFPQKILLMGNNAIVQTNLALYYYKEKASSLQTILNYKTGALCKYYNSIVYTKDNSINFLRIGKLSLSEKELFSNSKIGFTNIQNYIP